MGAVWAQWGGVLVWSAVGLVAATGLVIAMVRNGRPVRGPRRVNLVPLHDLLTLAPRDLVFAAVGLLLPVRFDARTPTVAVTAAAASAAVETLQYVLALGRVSTGER